MQDAREHVTKYDGPGLLPNERTGNNGSKERVLISRQVHESNDGARTFRN